MRLIVSDRGYFVFLALLPFIMGVLSLSVPGVTGLGPPNPLSDAPNQPGQVLVLMNVGAIDWRSGQKFDHTVFFDESVDIHHIFPRKWCEDHKKPPEYDSIINKTPLAFRTNRIIGGVAPSEYLAKLEAGGKEGPGIEKAVLDQYLASHLIDPVRLRADAFETFMADRQERLLRLIEKATGQTILATSAGGVATDDETDAETLESELTTEAAE